MNIASLIRKHIDELENTKMNLLCNPDIEDALTDIEKQGLLSSLDFINLAMRQLRIIELTNVDEETLVLRAMSIVEDRLKNFHPEKE